MNPDFDQFKITIDRSRSRLQRACVFKGFRRVPRPTRNRRPQGLNGRRFRRENLLTPAKLAGKMPAERDFSKKQLVGRRQVALAQRVNN
jgi:hypothetical protein